ncbi:serine protease grass [Drosophila teissieri]|uniref:serine protease grass n=1 Tax=Drosophila teissieri TaxID=7243 RepID=UPI001CBA4676|nr:serine protease grass [Drosophila teissieri]
MKNIEIFVLAVLLAFCSAIVRGSVGDSFLEQPCGTVPIHSFRIVGGHDAPVATAPWMAKVIGKRGFLCGGSLIAKRFVLTAAHCVGNEDLKVHLGVLDQEAKAQKFDVDGMFVHTEYYLGKHDIALLRLAKPVQYADNVSPICVLLDPLFKNLDELIIKFRTYGWGQTQSSSSSRMLQKTSLFNLRRAECSAQFPHQEIDRSHICAERASASTCTGDSGGPLTAIVTYLSVPTVFQFGVTSYGFENCSQATVFTNVMAHLDWIVNTVRREGNL